MGQVDWQKVAADYAHSTLDMNRLVTYARMVAAGLAGAGIPFDGHAELEVEQRKQGLLSKLIGARPAKQRIGYWMLEQTGLYQSHQDRQKTHYPKVGGLGGFSMQNRYGHTHHQIWVLLADGQLATFRSHRPTEMALAHGPARVEWQIMNGSDVLLLDHKTREIDRRYNSRSGSGFARGSQLSSENYLITGKKGGGCRKRLAALLKNHGLIEESASDRHGAPRQVDSRLPSGQPRHHLPIARTYTLTQQQLRDGCSIMHTFANGATKDVEIHPSTRSGKVITVRTRQSGGPEAIKVQVGGN